MEIELMKFRINEAPASIFYIPEFINETEEQYLISQVQNAPKPKWTQLSKRRLQNWGGLPHPKGMIAEPLPDWLRRQVDKVSEVGIFPADKKPNHVLINEYLPGQGIMAHTDGPLFHPIVTTITCGSHAILDFYKPRHDDQSSDQGQHLEMDDKTEACDKEKGPVVSLLLEPRSLVIVEDDMYDIMLHEIAERCTDEISKDSKVANISLCSDKFKNGGSFERSTRVSLTIRHVPKTKKLPGWFKV